MDRSSAVAAAVKWSAVLLLVPLMLGAAFVIAIFRALWRADR